MAVSHSKVVCPDCNAVLKPAKPIPAGKTVKCPKCGTSFQSPGADPDETPRPSRAPVIKKAAPTAKKAAPAAKKPVAAAPPPRPPDEEDDDSAGTYGVIKEEVEEEEAPKGKGKGRGADKPKSKKPQINYAPDMSIKDLRGPAMEVIVRPSNWMIFKGIMGFLGWLAFIVFLIIPILFPLDWESKPKDPNAPMMPPTQEDKDAAAKKKKDEDNPSIFQIGPKANALVNFADLAKAPWYMILLAFFGLVLCLVYSGIFTLGAVKIQNLESRGWGIASCIMLFLPINAGGIMLVSVLAEQFLLLIVFDYDWFLVVLLIVTASVEWLIQIIIGIWGLTVLLKPEVIAGFEYVPE